VYAPVGNHKGLLPYLVRRLLENGANSSFVNRFLDARVPPQELLRDPVEEALAQPAGRHPGIPEPRLLYRDEPAPWLNARGIDLADPLEVARLLPKLALPAGAEVRAAPIVGGQWWQGEAQAVTSPAHFETVVGHVVEATPDAIERALALATAAQPGWDAAGAEVRAGCLERLADLLEQHCETLMGLIISEAGRTVDDALSEVREAVDFCRYYACRGRLGFAAPLPLPGPTGEVNELSLHGRGVFLCISP
jgi:RHH-type proline utilization regulon transcriptional repressor/proline dehydrogenase/delta 1-pyrroline-5-carboxylate dehydrogenase